MDIVLLKCVYSLYVTIPITLGIQFMEINNNLYFVCLSFNANFINGLIEIRNSQKLKAATSAYHLIQVDGIELSLNCMEYANVKKSLMFLW